MQNIREYIENLISSYQIIIFSKSFCPYCIKAKELFTQLKLSFKSIELDQVENGKAIQEELAKLTGQKTVPNIFIKGKNLESYE